MNTIDYAIDDIHYVLATHLRPSYLLVTKLEEVPGEINVIVSCSQFRNKSIQKRIALVFNLIYSKIHATIVEDFLIVVQAFDKEEMLEYIDNCFEEQE